MRYQALAVVGGMLLFQYVARVPHPLVYACIIPITILLARVPRSRIVALCGVGFLWAMWRADLVLDARLDAARAGNVFNLTGTIANRPIDFGAGQRFDFHVRSATDAAGASLPLAVLKLSWYDHPGALQSGARCSLKARLKIPYGTRNPGAFDREKWLFTERVSATGYVVRHPANRCAENRSRWSLEGIRAAISERIRTLVPAGGAQGAIAALAVADRDGLDPAQWEILRATGTAHLLAISGLHISLVASAAFFAAHWGIGALAPVNRRWPVQRPAALVALAAAFAYSALAGFPISTQRALVMVGVVMICLIRRRAAISFDAYVIALLAVAVFDPPALLTAGFWLSFCAVACLLLINTTRPPATRVRRALLVHLYLAVGLTPMLGALHQSIPLASPLANLVAVPVVTLTIVPLVLAGVLALPFHPATTCVLWRVAAWLWDRLWAYLAVLADTLGPITLPSAPSGIAVGLAVAGVAVLLIPLLRARWMLAATLLAALALGQRVAPPAGQLRLLIFDVGQGLAVVVETATKVLVYDVGPAFGRFSAGADIIAPALRARGIARVDRLVVSHADADHAAGWPGLSEAMAVEDIWVGPGHRLPRASTTCRAGQRWVWDGVEFAMLSPRDRLRGTRNDLSCVLKITAPGGSVLLPGDIEKGAEERLLRQDRARLGADILIAPHHGSATSSTPPFVAAVDPGYVVFAAGYKNRFSFPQAEVVRRYDSRGAVVLTTGILGAIEFRISDRVERPRSYRRDKLRYWHHLEQADRGAGRF